MSLTISESLEQVRAFVTSGAKPEGLGLDGFPLFADDSLAPFHRQLNTYLREMPSQDRQFEYMCHVKPSELPAGKAILNFEPEDLAQTLRAIAVRLQYKLRTKGDQSAFSVSKLVRAFKIALKKDDFTQNRVLFRSLISDLLRSHLPLTADDLSTLVRMVANRPAGWWQEPISPEGLVHTLERHAAPSGDLPKVVREELEKWLQKLDHDEHLDSSRRKLLNRIGLLLGRGTDSGIESGEAWSNAALEDLKKMNPSALKTWAELLQHCLRADSSKPTQKWSQAANEFISAVGREKFKSQVIKWFNLVALPRPVPREPRDARHGCVPAHLLYE